MTQAAGVWPTVVATAILPIIIHLLPPTRPPLILSGPQPAKHLLRKVTIVAANLTTLLRKNVKTVLVLEDLIGMDQNV